MPIKETKKQMGQILCGALGIESHLEFFIANYFIRPQNRKTFFFKDKILYKMCFEDKIKLFKEICKREEYDKKEVSNIMRLIKHIQELRNKVAHWELISGLDKTIQLRDCKSCICEMDYLRLDEDTMQRFEKERLKAMDGITELYLKYFKEGTVDERPIL